MDVVKWHFKQGNYFSKNDSRILSLFLATSADTICLCMSCVFPSSGGENADQLSQVDTQCPNVADFLLLRDTHLFPPMHHLPDRCKDVGKPVIRINRVIVLALHILICMNLIFSHAQKGNKWKILF